ncbi:MAG: DUF3990 domain-containing protein [Lachnospiraceae bacterium]|nr:DUF3990 domain-containing protein [Lachnospiraceae bacterium]
MKYTIYHGSERIIEKPLYGYGKPYNDYGVGFYCTQDINMAKEWGVSLDRDGYANCYEIDIDGLEILNLNNGEYCILHWLSLLLKYREFDVMSSLAMEAKQYILDKFSIDCSQYDIIVGYRADDSYFSYAQDFINGTISYRQLTNAMHLGELGQQFVLKSERAFERIRFTDYKIAKYDEWYAKKMARDRNARREYFDIEKNRRKKDDIYVMQIIDEEMSGDDARLR